MNYQVAVNLKANPLMYEFAYDMSLDDVKQVILQPYVSGQTILINGKRLDQSEIGRLQITETDHGSSYLLQMASREVELEGYPSTHPVIKHFPSSMQDLYRDTYVSLRMMNRGRDVTNDLIRAMTSSTSTESQVRSSQSRPELNTNIVFVVHGRNEQARRAMFDFLRAIGLQPLEWSQAVKATGKTAPYIGEILDAAFSMAHAVVVLLTPDDEARLQQQFRKPNDESYEINLSGQARPNVLFEAGMAMGRDPNRTVLVELGRIRPFSDVAGRHKVPIDGGTESRQLLAERLHTAGCPVNTVGTDWHTTGDFRSCLEAIEDGRPDTSTATEIRRESASDVVTDATELLIEASNSVDGSITRLVVDHGSMIQSGGRKFCEAGDAKLEARWQRALNELIEHRLVEDQHGRGFEYKLTHYGFSTANEMKHQT